MRFSGVTLRLSLLFIAVLGVACSSGGQGATDSSGGWLGPLAFLAVVGLVLRPDLAKSLIGRLKPGGGAQSATTDSEPERGIVMHGAGPMELKEAPAPTRVPAPPVQAVTDKAAEQSGTVSVRDSNPEQRADPPKASEPAPERTAGSAEPDPPQTQATKQLQTMAVHVNDLPFDDEQREAIASSGGEPTAPKKPAQPQQLQTMAVHVNDLDFDDEQLEAIASSGGEPTAPKKPAQPQQLQTMAVHVSDLDFDDEQLEAIASSAGESAAPKKPAQPQQLQTMAVHVSDLDFDDEQLEAIASSAGETAAPKKPAQPQQLQTMAVHVSDLGFDDEQLEAIASSGRDPSPESDGSNPEGTA